MKKTNTTGVPEVSCQIVSDLNHFIEGTSPSQGHFEGMYDGMMVWISFNKEKRDWILSTRTRTTLSENCPYFLYQAKVRLGDMVSYLSPEWTYVVILRLPELVLADMTQNDFPPQEPIEVRWLGIFSTSSPIGGGGEEGEVVFTSSRCIPYEPEMPSFWKKPLIYSAGEVFAMSSKRVGFMYVKADGSRRMWFHPKFKVALRMKNGQYKHYKNQRAFPRLTWHQWYKRYDSTSMFSSLFDHMTSDFRM